MLEERLVRKGYRIKENTDKKWSRTNCIYREEKNWMNISQRIGYVPWTVRKTLSDMVGIPNDDKD